MREGKGESDTLYCQHATWDDAPHLSEQDKKDLESAIPEWQLSMRKTGMPTVGKGVVFPVSDNDIKISDITIQADWEVLWAIDIGSTNDPTVLTLAAKDSNTNTYYLVEQYVLDEDRGPEALAKVVKAHKYRKAPLIPPHDGSDGKDGSAGYATLLKQHGVDVRAHFYNPSSVYNNIIGTKAVRAKNEIAPGLHYMLSYFKNGKLKVSDTMENFFTEKHVYHRNDRGALKGEDHCIDSGRYAFMSLMANRGIPSSQILSGDVDSWNNGFESFNAFTDDDAWDY